MVRWKPHSGGFPAPGHPTLNCDLLGVPGTLRPLGGGPRGSSSGRTGRSCVFARRMWPEDLVEIIWKNFQKYREMSASVGGENRGALISGLPLDRVDRSPVRLAPASTPTCQCPRLPPPRAWGTDVGRALPCTRLPPPRVRHRSHQNLSPPQKVRMAAQESKPALRARPRLTALPCVVNRR
jgi:hypothetical protein